MKIAYMDGFIAGEPEEMQTKSGNYMLVFTLNSADNKRMADGEWDTTPHYFDCKYFYKDPQDRTAALIKAKDGKFIVVARPQQDRWEKDGEKRSKVAFIVKDVYVKPLGRQDKTFREERFDQMLGQIEENLPF